MENIRQKIAEIITHTHKTPLEQADEILLLFSVSQQRELLVAYEVSKQKYVSEAYRQAIAEKTVDEYLATNGG